MEVTTTNLSPQAKADYGLVLRAIDGDALGVALGLALGVELGSDPLRPDLRPDLCPDLPLPLDPDLLPEGVQISSHSQDSSLPFPLPVGSQVHWRQSA